MTALLSEGRPSPGRIGTAAVPDLALEDSGAKQYWSATAAQPHEHAGVPPHVLALEELCRATEARRILEFGCYSGRNLKTIGAAYSAAGETAPELVGLDINTQAIAAGAAEGLDLRLGDETALRAFADGEWDVVFTVSVLDHMPDPAAALEQLARITRRRLVLIEPHPLREGTGKAVQEGRKARDEPMPFTYLHDYDALLLGQGLVQELDLPMPTHLHRVGPFYRLRVLAPAASTGLRRRMAVQQGPVHLHGLPARTAARLQARAGGADTPALHIAAGTAGLEAALGRAAAADTIVAPRRTVELLPDGMLAGRLASPLDGFLVALTPDAAPGADRAPARDGARLQERLLLRILLQNREDAGRIRVLEGRLHRLDESTRKAAAVPAAGPPAGNDPAAAASVSHQLTAARGAWMTREIAGLIEEENQRASQWRLALGARSVAGQIGRAHREALLAALVDGTRRETLQADEAQRRQASRAVRRQVGGRPAPVAARAARPVAPAARPSRSDRLAVAPPLLPAGPQSLLGPPAGPASATARRRAERHGASTRSSHGDFSFAPRDGHRAGTRTTGCRPASRHGRSATAARHHAWPRDLAAGRQAAPAHQRLRVLRADPRAGDLSAAQCPSVPQWRLCRARARHPARRARLGVRRPGRGAPRLSLGPGRRGPRTCRRSR